MANNGASPLTGDSTTLEAPHVAVCCGAGMCHLVPCLSLASALSSSPYNFKVTLMVIVPTVSAAESNEVSSFLSSHPDIHRLDFHLDLAAPTTNMDPFIVRYASVSRSAHLLAGPLSSLSPPISAALSEFSLTMGLNTALPAHIPNYTIVPICAKFFALMSFLPSLHSSTSTTNNKESLDIHIPGIGSIPRQDIPPMHLLPDHPMGDLVASNARHLHLSKGILLSTFDSFEPETLAALRAGLVVPNLPPISAVGLLHTTDHHSRSAADSEALSTWLDDQPNESVVYVAFGSRTAMSREQIRELGMGLKRSGQRFLWVLKSTVVDTEEKEGLGELLGEELYHSLLCSKGSKGKIVNRWVGQREILGHPSVGLFVSHCGWSSVMEAAQSGVPVLCWPLGGDQIVNAGVVEKAGLGVWERGWGRHIHSDQVVGAAEIAEKVEALMGMEDLRMSVKRIREEAKRAGQLGGSSAAALLAIAQSFNHCN